MMTSFSSIETGLLLIKDGKAWTGIDPKFQSPSEGWGDATKPDLHSPELCKSPSDIARPGDPLSEMNMGKLVMVRKTIAVEFLEDK